MRKNITVIFNPISGIRPGKNGVVRLVSLLEDKGFFVEVLQTEKAGDARLFASQLDPSDHAVVSVGGDGTVNEIVSGLGNEKPPLAIWPVGTANVLAKELSLPSDVSRTAKMIAQGRVRKLDIGKAGHLRFVLMAGIGFDAQATVDLARSRRGNITLFSYAMPIIRTFRNYSFPKMHVEVDGKTVSTKTRLAVIGNVMSYAGPFSFAVKARPDDALLDVCMFEGATRRDLLRYTWGVFLRTHLDYEDVRYVQGREITVTAEPADGRPGGSHVPFQLDGDPAGHLPAKFEILPKALPVIVP